MKVNEAWYNGFNEILRKLYKDTEFKKLIRVPDNTSIVDFFDKYMIEAGYASELVVNEDVRIIYGLPVVEDVNNQNVKKSQLSFDIYVKKEHQRNADRDRLKLRTRLIANYLDNFLRSNKSKDEFGYLEGYNFWVKSEQSMGTRVENYARHNITFYFMKVY